MATGELRRTVEASPTDLRRESPNFRLVPLKNRKGSETTQLRNDIVLSGQLRQLNLFSVLQMLANNSNNTGNLVIRTGSQSGFIWIENGQLVNVTVGRHTGPKAFYRLVGLREGTFEFYCPGREASERNMAGRLDWHVLEAARHLDELAVLRQELPSGETQFTFNHKIIASVAKIPFPVLEVMAAIHKNETLTGILDGCTLPDLDICRILIKLLKQRVIRPANSDESNVVSWPRREDGCRRAAGPKKQR